MEFDGIFVNWRDGMKWDGFWIEEKIDYKKIYIKVEDLNDWNGENKCDIKIRNEENGGKDNDGNWGVKSSKFFIEGVYYSMERNGWEKGRKER